MERLYFSRLYVGLYLPRGIVFMSAFLRCCWGPTTWRPISEFPRQGRHIARFSQTAAPATTRQTLRIGNIQWNILGSATLLAPNPSAVVCTTCVPFVFFVSNDQQTPDSILSKLPSFSSQLHPDSHVPLLLVTPAFAQWLEKDHTFIPKLLHHCFREAAAAENLEICSVEAVVDKLPVPTNIKHNGMEGLSLAIVNWGAISGKLVPQRGIENISPSHIEPKLSISIRDPSTSTELEVGMPMANTLFTTGRPYTMHASRWKSTESIEDVPRITDRRDIRTCRVELRTKSTLKSLDAPLHPVTEPRIVAECMGNILKTVSNESSLKNDVPASAELEKAIPQYIQDHKLESQRLAVWAMVTPKSIARTHIGSPSGSSIDISASLKRGSRLYRVMSGGGGWGKKKGLLSLDPEYSYDDEEPISNLVSIHEIFDEDVSEKHSDDAILFNVLENTPKFTDVDGLMMSPLREVVTTGDIVQFFVASLDNKLAKAAMQSKSSVMHKDTAKDTTVLDFSVLPAPTDAPTSLPSEMLQDGSKKLDDIIVEANKFGASSEKSMVYARTAGDLTGDRVQASGTKIDTPGARLVVEIPSEEPFFRM
ncbi:conserved hypothetical protein [Trichophyton verrucosum HKI 0517]|uniref:V-type ATPase, C subunit family protein n=1 Tax=Trichophyton verrucosum (strain HKI 0517) TaxID=663202 RepID=D4D2N7_TRIVH|nr:uncharacterized protein TRV_01343 [Trichophyton verrucosum HKI 0517]EFE43901.1 conserved hypothetical protein [Trichophyton verrucosum HKI 0517]